MGLRPGEARDNLVEEADPGGLEEKLGYRFRDRGLLTRALTHRSYANEHAAEGVEHNERLEFLGDAVIHCVAAVRLYRADPTAREGELTLRRAALVSTGGLASAARRIDLGAHLRVGRGVAKGGGRDLDSLLANSLEAVFGAVYLDGGMRLANALFGRLAGAAPDAVNFKGLLQEVTQGRGTGVPVYRVVTTSGPSHARRYTVSVEVQGAELGEGEGATVRAAEQRAAHQALLALNTTYGGGGTAEPQYVDPGGPR